MLVPSPLDAIVAMSREDKIKAIKLDVLEKQRYYLGKSLGDPSRYYPFLRSKGIIDANSVQRINAKVTNADKVELLIDELLNYKEGRCQEHPLDILVDGIYREGVQNHIARVLLKTFLKMCTEGDLLYEESKPYDLIYRGLCLIFVFPGDAPLPPIEARRRSSKERVLLYTYQYM